MSIIQFQDCSTQSNSPMMCAIQRRKTVQDHAIPRRNVLIKCVSLSLTRPSEPVVEGEEGHNCPLPSLPPSWFTNRSKTCSITAFYATTDFKTFRRPCDSILCLSALLSISFSFTLGWSFRRRMRSRIRCLLHL